MDIKKVQWWQGGGASQEFLTITGATLDTLNRYIQIDFSDAVYDSENGPVEVADLQLIFTKGAGTATAASISSLTKIDGTALTGGESEIRAVLSITGSTNGIEKIEIKAAAAGTIISGTKIISATETTGEITLNVSYDSDYQAVLEYALDNGISIPSEAQRAVDSDKIGELKTAGAWVEFDCLFPLFNNIYTDFCLIDFKNPSTRQAVISGVIVKETYTGFKSNGTNSYIDFNFNTANNAVKFTLNDAGVWCAVGNNDPENADILLGARGNSTANNGNISFAPRNNSDLATFILNRDSTANATASNTNSTGIYLISREASNDTKLYKDGTEIGSTVAASATPLSSQDIFGCAQNQNGTPGNFNDAHYLRFFAISSGMRDIQSTTRGILNDWITETAAITPPSLPPTGAGDNWLIVLMGQSNMDGRANISDLSGEYKTALDYVNIWWDGEWQQYQAGVNGNFTNQTTKHGPLPIIAYNLKQAYPTDNFYFVNQGIGGSSLYGGWAADTGANYIGCVNTVNTAIAALSGITFQHKKGVWYQGETDSAIDQATADAYEANEQAFIDAINTDLGFTTDIITCNVSTSDSINAYVGTVRQAKIDNAAALYYVLEETSDLNPTGLVHLTSSMFVTLGDRITENWGA